MAYAAEGFGSPAMKADSDALVVLLLGRDLDLPALGQIWPVSLGAIPQELPLRPVGWPFRGSLRCLGGGFGKITYS